MPSTQRQAFGIPLLTPILLIIFILINFSASISAVTYEKQELQQQKVDVSIYYEALCPYCSYFISHQLTRIFTEEGLQRIVHLRLIPWGNAAVDRTGTFRCQHGPRECFLNTIEACAITVYPDSHFILIQCIENLTYQQRETEWERCFQNASLDSKPVFDCYNTGHGHQIELQYAYETTQLNPPHAYVPWVIVNNQPLKEDYVNFITYICRAYRGDTIPQACNARVSLEHKLFDGNGGDSMINTTNSTSQVCYPGRFKRE